MEARKALTVFAVVYAFLWFPPVVIVPCIVVMVCEWIERRKPRTS